MQKELMKKTFPGVDIAVSVLNKHLALLVEDVFSF